MAWAVNRVEIDALRTAGEGSNQAIEPHHLPVGDGDSLSDPGALQRFALQQHLDQLLRLDLRLDLRQGVGHL